MPPVRTKKSTPSKLGGPLSAFGFVKIDKEEALARAAKGEKVAMFHGDSGGNSYIFQCDLEAQVGTATREGHIDTLVTKFPNLCQKLWSIELVFMDPYREPYDGYTDVDDADLIRLAKACPALRAFKLPYATKTGDAAFPAFCRHCPSLTRLEIFTTNCLRATGAWFDEVRENPSWAPKLKRVTITKGEDERIDMDALLAMSKVRSNLLITFVRGDEDRGFRGRYELMAFMDEKYRGGKKVKCQPCHQEVL
ncbi:hypothetical protein K4K57_001357 [Colletotrichum sp. SAR 10_99]|nr:hypothetical protein K4K55_002312 [Colletotrichum sp. SAR 10_96]KAJ5019250.1 hypothetical protein K4K57_001357 [Colletotrichum sp. SAR 10_99]